MPTGSRLVSALFYGFLTYVAAHMVHAAFEADVGYDLNFGKFKEVAALIGVITGWTVQGSRVGEGKNFAIQGGILTVVLIIFWNLIFWSLREMVLESMKLKYRGPTAALVDSFRIALDNLMTFATVQFCITVFVGGILGGILAERSAQRYD